MDWTDFFTGISQAGTSIANAVIGPRTPYAIPGAPGAVYIPPAASGQFIQTPTGLSSVLGVGSGSNSMLIVILLAVVLIFALRK